MRKTTSKPTYRHIFPWRALPRSSFFSCFPGRRPWEDSPSGVADEPASPSLLQVPAKKKKLEIELETKNYITWYLTQWFKSYHIHDHYKWSLRSIYSPCNSKKFAALMTPPLHYPHYTHTQNCNGVSPWARKSVAKYTTSLHTPSGGKTQLLPSCSPRREPD